MDDLRRRFGSLDRLPAPDLWTEIESRAMAFDAAGYAAVGVRRRTQQVGPRRSPIVLLAGAALLLVLLAGLTIVIGSLLRDSQRTLPLQGTFTPAGPLAVQRYDEGLLAVGLTDGRVLVMGGSTTGNEQRDIKQAEIFDPGLGTFSRTGEMLEGHGIYTSATLLADGRVLIVGGWNPTETGDQAVGAELYDPATGEFTATGPMVMSRYGHTATLLADGRVLIAGGDVSISGNDVARPPAELFDPTTGAFTAIGSLAVDRLYHTATRLVDGRVLLAGGSNAASATAELFDASSGTFTAVGDLAQGRNSHTATLLEDGRVLITGGNGAVVPGDATLASAELFDPASGRFTETGSLTTRRSDHEAVRLPDGRVLVTAGYNFDGSPRGTEIYDPSTGRFSLGALAQGIGQRAAVGLADGRVLVVGGDPNGGQGEAVPQMAELFDPAGESSVTVAARPSSSSPFEPIAGDIDQRWGQSATLMDDGRVLIAGGSELDWKDVFGRPLASAVIYDPATGGVTETGSLGTPRAFHAATLLADGRVLIAGGDGPGQLTDDPNDVYDPLASVEIYDPATGIFTTASPMRTARGPAFGPSDDTVRPLALPLVDGRVLLAGGVTGSDGPQEVVLEIYDPATGTSENLARHCPAGAYWGGVGQALDDGRVLLACGESAVVFDPRSGSMTQTFADDWQAGWGIDVGGITVLTAGETGPINGVDPSTGRVSRVDDTGRRFLSDALGGPDVLSQVVVRLPDGRAFVVGRDYDQPANGVAAIIDPATGEVTRLQPLAARGAPTVTVLKDGRVLIAGRPFGSPDHFEPRPPNAELFDPSRVDADAASP